MIVKRLTALAVILLFFSTAFLSAQEAAIGDVKRGSHNDALVAISGRVVPGPRVGTQSVRGYYLQDRFNDAILIKTTSELPPLDSTYKITGVAQQDADTREIFVQEKERVLLDPKPPTLTPRLPDYTKTFIVIGTAIVALIALALLLSYRQKQKATPDPFFPEVTPVPSAGSVDDFKTVRVYKTTKVLPGTLVVMESGKETDVIYLSDQSGRGEVEIGRESPGTSGGIRVKDATSTVSRRQARLIYCTDTREFSVVNLATEQSNPTTLNGKSLRTDETASLADGDLVGMGTLEMKFRRR